MTDTVAQRQNRATHLMNAAEARGIICEMEQQVRNPAKRKKMAAFYATNIFGKLSDEAVAVYRAYSTS
jgi:hypothetical protein